MKSLTEFINESIVNEWMNDLTGNEKDEIKNEEKIVQKGINKLLE